YKMSLRLPYSPHYQSLNYERKQKTYV
ncbi:hypothetical protein CWATWH0003_3679b1, partial [Crocosphaera watsonii WH 0003]